MEFFIAEFLFTLASIDTFIKQKNFFDTLKKV